jgi:peptidoglycan/LPS O-acetylase OafA/YrhL
VLGDVFRSVFGFFLGLLVFDLYAVVKARGWRPHATLEFAAAVAVGATVTWLDALPEYLPPLIFAATVFILSFEAGPVSRLLVRRFFLRLGDASYSIYLTHSLYVLAMADGVVWAAGLLGKAPSIEIDGDDVMILGGPWAMDAVVALTVIVAVIGSGLTWRYIEEPGRLFFNALSNGETISASARKARDATRRKINRTAASTSPP